MQIQQTQGQILGAAHALLLAHKAALSTCRDSYCQIVNPHINELRRLLDNTMSLRNDWGDPIQLAGLIVFIHEGFRSNVLDME